jgi:hypothetical protein
MAGGHPADCSHGQPGTGLSQRVCDQPVYENRTTSSDKPRRWFLRAQGGDFRFHLNNRAEFSVGIVGYYYDFDHPRLLRRLIYLTATNTQRRAFQQIPNNLHRQAAETAFARAGRGLISVCSGGSSLRRPEGIPPAVRTAGQHHARQITHPAGGRVKLGDGGELPSSGKPFDSRSSLQNVTFYSQPADSAHGQPFA